MTVDEFIKHLQSASGMGGFAELEFSISPVDELNISSIHASPDGNTVRVAMSYEPVSAPFTPSKTYREEILTLVGSGKTKVREVTSILDRRYPFKGKGIRRELRVMLEDGTLDYDDQLELKRIREER